MSITLKNNNAEPLQFPGAINKYGCFNFAEDEVFLASMTPDETADVASSVFVPVTNQNAEGIVTISSGETGDFPNLVLAANTNFDIGETTLATATNLAEAINNSAVLLGIITATAHSSGEEGFDNDGVMLVAVTKGPEKDEYSANSNMTGEPLDYDFTGGALGNWLPSVNEGCFYGLIASVSGAGVTLNLPSMYSFPAFKVPESTRDLIAAAEEHLPFYAIDGMPFVPGDVYQGRTVGGSMTDNPIGIIASKIQGTGGIQAQYYAFLHNTSYGNVNDTALTLIE